MENRGRQAAFQTFEPGASGDRSAGPTTSGIEHG
jgi:hypothetical protein